jgi:hypothetical protein
MRRGAQLLCPSDQTRPYQHFGMLRECFHPFRVQGPRRGRPAAPGLSCPTSRPLTPFLFCSFGSRGCPACGRRPLLGRRFLRRSSLLLGRRLSPPHAGSDVCDGLSAQFALRRLRFALSRASGRCGRFSPKGSPSRLLRFRHAMSSLRGHLPLCPSAGLLCRGVGFRSRRHLPECGKSAINSFLLAFKLINDRF